MADIATLVIVPYDIDGFCHLRRSLRLREKKSILDKLG